MRPFEIQLGVALGGCAILAAFTRIKGLPLLAAALIIGAAALAHFYLEGFRPQAAPIYLAALPLAAMLYFQMPRAAGVLLALFCLGSAGAGLTLCYAIPVFDLPQPTGPYAIGSSTVYLTDDGRVEIHAAAAGQPRKFVAQIWYPAQDCKGYPAATYRDAAALSIRSMHMRHIRTHACVDAPVLKTAEKFPVVYFSPSSGGYRSQNSFLLEDLVSHGYVAVGLDHPYSSSRVVLADGSVIHSLPDDWLMLRDRESLAKSIPIVETTMRTRAGDIEFTDRMLRERRLGGRPLDIAEAIDFERTGAIGHSFGGGVAAELCRRNPRFKAGINFDGWMFSGVREEGVPKPFFFAIEADPLWLKNDGPYGDDEWGLAREGTKDYHDMIRRSVAKWGGYVLRPTRVGHGGFADMCLYTRWPAPGACPGVETAHVLLRKFTLAYLDLRLKGQAQTLLENSAANADYEFLAMTGNRKGAH